jgi:hypothetical protein
MTDRELMDKAWDYLASYTVGERPNASEVNDLIAVIEDRMNQPERQWVGLTEDDAIELLPVGDWEIESTLQFAKNIEAKLKEKNAC